jgi:hypothetical protein
VPKAAPGERHAAGLQTRVLSRRKYVGIPAESTHKSAYRFFAAAASRFAMFSRQSRIAFHMLLKPMAVPAASSLVSSRFSQRATTAECMIRLKALTPCADTGTPENDNTNPAAKAAHAKRFISTP